MNLRVRQHDTPFIGGWKIANLKYVIFSLTLDKNVEILILFQHNIF